MKIQGPKRILTNDFSKDDQEVASKMGGLLNTFNEEIHRAISKNLTIADNLDQEIKIFTAIVDANGVPTTSISFRSNLRSNLSGMQVIRALGNNYPNSQPFISYTQSSGIITVDHIAGLPANTQFQLVVLLIGN